MLMNRRVVGAPFSCPIHNPHTDQLVSNWRAHLSLGKPQIIRSGSRLFSQGEIPRCFFLLASGLVKLTCNLSDGREVAVHLCQPGRFVDTVSHLLNGVYATTATALTDCAIFCNETAAILDALCRDREVVRLWVQQQADELRQVRNVILDHRTLTAQQRFEKLLWDLAAIVAGESRLGSCRLPPSVTETQMAELISVSIGQVSRMKRKLQRVGLIEHRGKGIVLLDAGALFHDVTL